MRICLVGEGAQASTYMKALGRLEGAQVVTLAGGIAADAAAFAEHWGIPHHAPALEPCLEQPGVEAVILTSPSQVHAEQAILSLEHGKHVLVEIPMSLTLADAERVVKAQRRAGRVCMVAHTRRYSKAIGEVHARVQAGALDLLHLVFQTYFFRRQNINRFGHPRTWTDDLLWHHGCHVVDVVHWMLDDPAIEVWAQAGPAHAELGIPMDLTIGMRSRGGTLVSAALSFNNHGPIRNYQRYIGQQETLRFEHGVLLDAEDRELLRDDFDESFVSQCAEFLDAIAEDREPLTGAATCLPVMEILDRIQRVLDAGDGAPR